MKPSYLFLLISIFLPINIYTATDVIRRNSTLPPHLAGTIIPQSPTGQESTPLPPSSPRSAFDADLSDFSSDEEVVPQARRGTRTFSTREGGAPQERVTIRRVQPSRDTFTAEEVVPQARRARTRTFSTREERAPQRRVTRRRVEHTFTAEEAVPQETTRRKHVPFKILTPLKLQNHIKEQHEKFARKERDFHVTSILVKQILTTKTIMLAIFIGSLPEKLSDIELNNILFLSIIFQKAFTKVSTNQYSLTLPKKKTFYTTLFTGIQDLLRLMDEKRKTRKNCVQDYLKSNLIEKMLTDLGQKIETEVAR